jgi:outer membrane protein assembly factor BamB
MTDTSPIEPRTTMNRNLVVAVATAAAFLLLAGQSLAQVSSSGLVDDGAARRIGLTRAWYSQVQLDTSRERVSHVVMHVSSSRALTIHRVVYERGVESFPETLRDAFGNVVGPAKAGTMADDRVQALAKNGIEATVETRVVPEITLYVMTDSSVLHAIDGETGRARWSRVVGRREWLSLAPGISDDYVAVVNGATVYLIDSQSGESVWDHDLIGVPGAGPAVSAAMVHVPCVNGFMESFEISDPRKARAYTYSDGRALIQPTVTANSLFWPTDRGHLYVAQANKRGLRYRLEAQNTIVAPAVPAQNRLLVSSIDGYVYCLQEYSGSVLWRFSTGEPISQSPMPIQDSVYIATDDGNLFCVGLEDGVQKWPPVRVREFIAASNDRIYCTTRTGALAVFDAATGSRRGSIDVTTLDLRIPNWQTDRIYVGTKRGLIQCLHELPLDLPVVHEALELQTTDPALQLDGNTPEGPATKPTPPDDDNPFGPGAGAKPPAGGADDDNPFGAGAATPPPKSGTTPEPPDEDNPFE